MNPTLARFLCGVLPFAVSSLPVGVPAQGMPPVVDRNNLYSEAGAGKFSPAVADALPRAYVPNLQTNDVYVIDPATRKVIDKFRVGINPQHIVPSWDLKTLWVTNNAEGRTDGTLTPIDPKTGKPGQVLWLSGRYDNVVYAIDTTSGEVTKIPVGKEPHGLTVWPQPGRYSLGHTGNMR